MLNVSQEATEKILERLEAAEQSELMLRVEIVGRHGDDFQYRLSFVPHAMPHDTTVHSDGLAVLIDPVSARYLEGASLEYEETPTEAGLKFDNPNPLWHEPVAAEVNQLIQTQVNPAIAIHGGHVTLLDVKDDVAYVSMGGGCQGCGMASVTLRHGVEKMLMDSVPSLKGLVDTTDHASGLNPYFQPEAEGESPVA